MILLLASLLNQWVGWFQDSSAPVEPMFVDLEDPAALIVKVGSLKQTHGVRQSVSAIKNQELSGWDYKIGKFGLFPSAVDNQFGEGVHVFPSSDEEKR